MKGRIYLIHICWIYHLKNQEIILTIAENLVDNLVLTKASSLIEEVTKALPLAGIGVGIYNTYKGYKHTKQINQIQEFVREGETLKAGTLLAIFNNANNLEMGMEILHALDQCYLDIQSKMMARLALLYDCKEIDRDRFLKYSHIIPRLTSHLLSQIERCYQYHLERKDLDINDYRILMKECGGAAVELTSYSFLQAHMTAGGGDFYQATDELIFFYEYLYNNKNGKD